MICPSLIIDLQASTFIIVAERPNRARRRLYADNYDSKKLKKAYPTDPEGKRVTAVRVPYATSY